MMKSRMFLVLLSLSLTSFAGLRVSTDFGGTVSTLGNKFREEIHITDNAMVTSVRYGIGTELLFKEVFGIGTGIYYEKKGASFQGDISILRGQYDFRFTSLQIPFHGKVIIPLLIPGSVFIALGPEFGINLERKWDIRLGNSSTIYPDTAFERRSSAWDFGLSGKIGYELPMSRYFFLNVFGGYYFGLIDLYKNTDEPPNDFNLYNRTITFGVSVIANVKEF